VATEEIQGLCKPCAAGFANPRKASRCVKCGSAQEDFGKVETVDMEVVTWALSF